MSVGAFAVCAPSPDGHEEAVAAKIEGKADDGQCLRREHEGDACEREYTREREHESRPHGASFNTHCGVVGTRTGTRSVGEHQPPT